MSKSKNRGEEELGMDDESLPPPLRGSNIAVGGEVERVDGRQLSYGEFVRRFLVPNRPVVLTGLMDGGDAPWRACADWVTADGRPNLPFFAAHFGNSLVQVAECSKREFTDQKRVEMSVADFINYWLEISAINSKSSKCCGDNDSLLYLKDWHFVKEYPDYIAYNTPIFFIDDWLNLYLDSHPLHRDSDISRHKNEVNCADYRFVYMGPKGTWTPLHADVFRSYSWSANICGRKLWLFLPPSQSHLVFDRACRTSVYNIYNDVSETEFPGFKKAIWLKCIQEQNEIIFVPSGWYHQVHNLEDTISINHNWFNGHNLSWVWHLLLKDYNEAKEYIEDIRDIADDFEGLCQRNLAANTGMNFYDFMVLITRFTLAKLLLLCHLRCEENYIGLSENIIKHLFSNLISLRAVASKMKPLEAFSEENMKSCSTENHDAFSNPKLIFTEQDFHELCTGLIKMYKSIYQQQKPYSGESTVPCWKDCLLPKWTEMDCELLKPIISLNSKICGPADIVRLIDHAMEVTSTMYNNCNFGSLSEFHDAEPLVI